MKAEFDKEIDALLRRNARAAAGRVARPDGGASSAHLDADELSAFAENALPAAARLSAVAHLADCDGCRKTVVMLSGAADAAGELERRAVAAAPASVDAQAPAGGWLASLFSPRVLRFVAPVLALCLVAAVALLVLRTRREAGNQVAMERAPERDAARQSAPASSGVANIGTANANASISAEQPAADAGEQRPAEQGTDREAPRPVAPVNESPDGSADEQPRDAPAQPTSVAESVGVTAAPPPPPPPRPAATEAASGGAPATAQPPAEDAREESKVKKEDRQQGEEETAQAAKRADPSANLDYQQAPDDSRRNRPARSATSTPAPRPEPERRNRSLSGPAPGRSADGAGARARERDESGTETREVAGHRFRREGRAWVDVNYRGSMSTTGVRRGTEAFRALVADIPELGRIAGHLSGEVITVVRGRAYRIQ